MTKGVEIQVLLPYGWDTSVWMSGASAQELRVAVQSTRVKYPGLAIRVLKNGKIVPLPKV